MSGQCEKCGNTLCVCKVDDSQVDEPREYYWVQEDAMFANAGSCLDKFPDLGAAALLVNHTYYDKLKAELDGANSTSHEVVLAALQDISNISDERDQWMHQAEKMAAALKFYANKENYDHETGAIHDMVPKGTDNPQKLWKVLEFGERAIRSLSDFAAFKADKENGE